MSGPSVHVLHDEQHVAELAAEILANRMLARPGARLLLPTGGTPLGLYAALRRRRAAGVLETRGAEVFQLDEYRGVDPEGPHGYRRYLREQLDGSGLELTHWLDPEADDLRAEAQRYQSLLEEREIDLAVLGLGRDGHVAFDEPGSSATSGVRRVRLAAATREDAAEEFGGLAHVPHEAVTVGMSTLLEAREALMLVTGAAKAEALHAVLAGSPRDEVPASHLRHHPRLTILCDRTAAARLTGVRGARSDHAVVVLGHREAGSPQHRVSQESFARLASATGLADGQGVRAVVLTGFTTTGGLSEAEQMAKEWTGATPLLLEVAGRDTAENATRSLPLILALGGIRRVTVVSSWWHLRAPAYFAPYRDHGLTLAFRGEFRGPWVRMLMKELRLTRRLRATRRHAWEDVRIPPGPLA